MILDIEVTVDLGRGLRAGMTKELRHDLDRHLGPQQPCGVGPACVRRGRVRMSLCAIEQVRRLGHVRAAYRRACCIPRESL